MLIDTPELLNEAVILLRSAPLVAIDIEDTGAMAGPLKLVSLAFTVDGDTAYVLNLRSGERVFLPADLRRLKTALGQTPGLFHNGYHDRLQMRKFGLDLQVKHDTMAIAYLLDQGDPQTTRKGLEYLAENLLGAEPWKDVDYKHILDEPWDKIERMNGRDACYTFRLFKPLMARLEANPQLRMIYRWVLMPAITLLVEVTENGVPVDKDRLAELTAVISAEHQEQLEWLQANTPPPQEKVFPNGWPKHKVLGKTFNPGSASQVAHILYDIKKVPPVPKAGARASKAKRSTDHDTLLQMAERSPSEWIDKLLAYRRTSILLNNFLNKWPAMWDEAGYLHPRYKPLHTTTGRLASEGPNIQNVPREKRFRNVFGGVAGYTWVKADYSQIELRLAAWLAREETMLEAFRRRQDLHSLTARLVLGSEDKTARDAGKMLNFALLYGAYPATMQRIARLEYGLHITKEQATEDRKKFFQAYPSLALWHKDMERQLSSTGRAVSPIGRIRHLPNARLFHSKDQLERGLGMQAVREGLNSPIQGFASDLLLVAMLRVQPIVKKHEAKMVCSVHDEMDFLVPVDNVEPFTEEVKAIMEDTAWLEKFGVKLDVPLVAELTTGTHWGGSENG